MATNKSVTNNLNWSNSTSLEEKELPINKLTVYLIRKGMEDNCLSERAKLDKKTSRDKTEIYKANSFIKQPKFMEQFFHDADKEVYSSSAQVLLLLKDVGKYKRTVAFAFGNGRCLLNQDAIERRFGLKTALNLIDPESVKKFSKTKLDSNPKNENSQLSKKAKVSEFGIDITQDLIKGVSGAVKPDCITRFGKNISGTDSLNLRVQCDISNIREIAERILEAYEDDSYKKSFGWIDQIQEIKDKLLINELNEQLIQDLRNKNKNTTDKVWASIPEYIEDDDLDGYRIGKKNDKLLDDINKHLIIKKLNGKIDIKHLKMLNVYATSSADDSVILGCWRAYRCLYAEIAKNDNIFLLLDGSWYAINTSFVDEVRDEYYRIKYKELGYPNYNHRNEADYNKLLAKDIKGKCCDKKPIQLAGYDKVELCDVLSAKQDFIHIKRYSSSSVLSHLFNQGLVSGELLKNHPTFRRKVEAKLDINLDDTSGKRIVFGIITNKAEKFDMPFFSKVSLINVVRRLSSLGYEVEITRIRNVKGDSDE